MWSSISILMFGITQLKYNILELARPYVQVMSTFTLAIAFALIQCE